jgi:hypothetical protein
VADAGYGLERSHRQVTIPSWAWSAIAAAILVGIGFGMGYHMRGNAIAQATVKQVQKVAKIEEHQQVQTEKQNVSDSDKVKQLQQDLDAAQWQLAHSGMPIRPRCSVPAPVANAGPGSPASAPAEPAGGSEAADREMAEGTLAAGAVAETLRLQVISCQAQWPK